MDCKGRGLVNMHDHMAAKAISGSSTSVYCLTDSCTDEECCMETCLSSTHAGGPPSEFDCSAVDDGLLLPLRVVYGDTTSAKADPVCQPTLSWWDLPAIFTLNLENNSTNPIEYDYPTRGCTPELCCEPASCKSGQAGAAGYRGGDCGTESNPDKPCNGSPQYVCPASEHDHILYPSDNTDLPCKLDNTCTATDCCYNTCHAIDGDLAADKYFDCEGNDDGFINPVDHATPIVTSAPLVTPIVTTVDGRYGRACERDGDLGKRYTIMDFKQGDGMCTKAACCHQSMCRDADGLGNAVDCTTRTDGRYKLASDVLKLCSYDHCMNGAEAEDRCCVTGAAGTGK